MKVYIAGPMSGLPDNNYPAFIAAERQLTELGYDALNPVHAEHDNPTPGTEQTWQWYMRKALVMVAAADGVALLDGWRISKGARLEYHVALTIGLDVRDLDGWLLS